MEEHRSVGANFPNGSSGLPHTYDWSKNCFRPCSVIGIAAREGHRDNKHYSNHHRQQKPVKCHLWYQVEFGRKLRES